MNRPSSFRRTLLACLAIPLLLSACSTLPSDGPTARDVARDVKAPKGAHYAVVDVDYRVAQIITANPEQTLTTLRTISSTSPTDLIGAGDVLAISIYQAGLGPSSLGPSDRFL